MSKTPLKIINFKKKDFNFKQFTLDNFKGNIKNIQGQNFACNYELNNKTTKTTRTCWNICYLNVFHLMIATSYIPDDFYANIKSINNNVNNNSDIVSRKQDEVVKSMKKEDKIQFITYILNSIIYIRNKKKLKFNNNFLIFLADFNLCHQHDPVDILMKIIPFDDYYKREELFLMDKIDKYIKRPIIEEHIKNIVPYFLQQVELKTNTIFIITKQLTSHVNGYNKELYNIHHNLKKELLEKLYKNANYNISSLILYDGDDAKGGHYSIVLNTYDNDNSYIIINNDRTDKLENINENKYIIDKYIAIILTKKTWNKNVLLINNSAKVKKSEYAELIYKYNEEGIKYTFLLELNKEYIKGKDLYDLYRAITLYNIAKEETTKTLPAIPVILFILRNKEELNKLFEYLNNSNDCNKEKIKIYNNLSSEIHKLHDNLEINDDLQTLSKTQLEYNTAHKAYEEKLVKDVFVTHAYYNSIIAFNRSILHDKPKNIILTLENVIKDLYTKLHKLLVAEAAPVPALPAAAPTPTPNAKASGTPGAPAPVPALPAAAPSPAAPAPSTAPSTAPAAATPAGPATAQEQAQAPAVPPAAAKEAQAPAVPPASPAPGAVSPTATAAAPAPAPATAQAKAAAQAKPAPVSPGAVSPTATAAAPAPAPAPVPPTTTTATAAAAAAPAPASPTAAPAPASPTAAKTPVPAKEAQAKEAQAKEAQAQEAQAKKAMDEAKKALDKANEKTKTSTHNKKKKAQQAASIAYKLFKAAEQEHIVAKKATASLIATNPATSAKPTTSASTSGSSGTPSGPSGPRGPSGIPIIHSQPSTRNGSSQRPVNKPSTGSQPSTRITTINTKKSSTNKKDDDVNFKHVLGFGLGSVIIVSIIGVTVSIL
jgi:hypothetical protein